MLTLGLTTAKNEKKKKKKKKKIIYIWPCHRFYRVEAVGLSFQFLVSMWNLGQFREKNWYFGHFESFLNCCHQIPFLIQRSIFLWFCLPNVPEKLEPYTSPSFLNVRAPRHLPVKIQVSLGSSDQTCMLFCLTLSWLSKYLIKCATSLPYLKGIGQV